MKKTITRIAGLVISAMLLGACSQMATFENEDLMLKQEAAAKSGFNLTPYGTAGNENASLSNCANCITDIQVKTVVINKSTGNPANPTITPHAEYSVWNTSSSFVMTYRFYGTDNGSDHMQVSINGTTYHWFKDGAKDPAFTNVVKTKNGKIRSFQITQALGVKTACTEYPVSVLYNGGPGGSLSSSTTYNIYEYCVAIAEVCDEESFSYVASNENLDVVFSYNYSEAAHMKLTFTLPQAKIQMSTGSTYIGADGKSYLVGGNGTNLTWVGDVSCSLDTPTTFAFNFAADCGPGTANDGKANIWTNTEVKAINGVTLVEPYSLKGTLSSIVYSGCPRR
jgi:hypothetical protein